MTAPSRILRRAAAFTFASLLALAVATTAGTALASEASDALKKAKDLKAQMKKASDDAARADLEGQIKALAKEKSDALANAAVSRLDRCYLGELQILGGLKEEGLASLRAAVDSKEETKYGAYIHLALLNGLIDIGNRDGAAAELVKMRGLYDGQKELKIATMNLGMAYRAALEFEKSCEFLQASIELKDWPAAKPLVNGWLMAGKKDKAVAAAKLIAETGPKNIKEDMETLVAITEKHGEKIDLPKFDAFVPVGEPEIGDRVVVIGVWNMSAKTLKWTLSLLDKVKSGFGDEVVTLAVTTYYKKNAETGQMEESITPDQERGWGSEIRTQMGYEGRMAWVPTETDLKMLGVSALPHILVRGRDGTLLFAHTMNPADGTDVDILKKVLKDATAR